MFILTRLGRRFSDEGGRRTCLAGMIGRGQIEVRDTGEGIPPGDRDRVFEPFYTQRESGTGLGLFVSYGIIERHGGTITIDDAPEGGARFVVSRPRAESPPGG